MNWLLIVIILGLGAGLYFMHDQDQATISALQQQVQELSAKNAALTTQPQRPAFAYPTSEAPAAPPAQAIDAARAAAQGALTGADLGTVMTLDGHTYGNCRFVKQDQNGVTFNDDTGITEIPYWNMTTGEQKEFGYDLHKAAATAEAQARYDAQQATANAGANP